MITISARLGKAVHRMDGAKLSQAEDAFIWTFFAPAQLNPLRNYEDNILISNLSRG